MRYLCIHGHFYQPPRENPWLEAIELQDSAYPYHDWNERITAECYAPNAAARILDGEGRITKIVNNYSRISFNFGPTLLAWMKDKAPDVHNSDRRRPIGIAARNSPGHGSALAQVLQPHDHAAGKRRDKYTQIYWGIADFEHRFGREPEGMWLPETAVDLGVAGRPGRTGRQASRSWPRIRRSRVRRHRRRATGTTSAADASIRRGPTLRQLPSGRSIALFFYDGPISRAVAFEGLLDNGEVFAERLHAARYSDGRDGRSSCTSPPTAKATAIITATARWRLPTRCTTSSETRARQADQLRRVPREASARRTKSRSMKTAPGVAPTASAAGRRTAAATPAARRLESGVARAACARRSTGCATTIAPLYEQPHGASTCDDPWEARNDYIEVILDRSPENVDGVPDRRTPPRNLTAAEQVERLEAAGAAAPRHADVHELRLVLRRALRHRDSAGHPVCRQGCAA